MVDLNNNRLVIVLTSLGRLLNLDGPMKVNLF